MSGGDQNVQDHHTRIEKSLIPLEPFLRHAQCVHDVGNYLSKPNMVN